MTAPDPPVDPFLALTDDAAHRRAVTARREARERRRRAEELAGWVGTLRDVAERGRTVVLRTARRRHRGQLAAVAADHLVVRLHPRGTVLVALDAVRFLRPEPDAPAPPATGDRGHAFDRTLDEALHRLAEDGEVVGLGLRDVDEPVSGTVVGLGEDVVSLRPATSAGVVYVPLPAVQEIAVDR